MSDPTPPGPSARQVSGVDPEGRFVLSVLVKRTYRFDRAGRVRRADEDLPLALLPVLDPERPGFLIADSDLYPYKPRTDVVVFGHAYGPAGATSFEASIAVGQYTKRILVVGDRSAALRPDGTIAISDPAPVGAVPLTFERAYGGADAAACALHGNPMAGLAEQVPEEPIFAKVNPYAYPRNPNGRGFVIEATRAAIDGLMLPNLEDPDDRLTADRIAVGRLERWPAQPLPAATGWVSHGWFPRVAYIGFKPADPGYTFAEVGLGAVPQRMIDGPPGFPEMDLGFANGAPAGLQVPLLRGGEAVVLAGLHAEAREIELRIPGDRPALWTDGRKGKRGETDPVIHTVIVEPDEERLSIVWRGSCPALRPYSAEELARMPFWVEG